MPLPAFEALVTLGISARIWASIITFAFMWIVRRKFYALPKIPPEFARDLRGQVVFITVRLSILIFHLDFTDKGAGQNAFTPLALPCVEALLGQGCKVIALASAELVSLSSHMSPLSALKTWYLSQRKSIPRNTAIICHTSKQQCNVKKSRNLHRNC